MMGPPALKHRQRPIGRHMHDAAELVQQQRPLRARDPGRAMEVGER